MKLHQQGNEIIVTELRPMSDAKQDEWAIYFSKNYHSFEAMLIGRNVVTAANEFIKIEDIEGWLPMPQYRPELKQTKENDIDYYHGA